MTFNEFKVNHMARTTDVWKFLILGTLAHVSLAQAQQAQQPPSSAPPKMERVDEGADTPLTTLPEPRRGPKVAEKRIDGGRTAEVEVSTGKSTYTMKANPPDTVSQPGDPASGGLRPPQWKVMEFDLFNKKKQGETAEATGTAAAPPPPPPAKSK